MRIEEIHFDEVFDAQPRRGDFSFRGAGQVHYGVQLQNGVIPRDGARFAIAFADPGNWSTVLGWRDLASAEVTLKHPGWSAWLSMLGDVILFGPFVVGGALVFGGPPAALVAATLAAGLAVYRAGQVRRLNRAVRRALLAAR